MEENNQGLLHWISSHKKAVILAAAATGAVVVAAVLLLVLTAPKLTVTVAPMGTVEQEGGDLATVNTPFLITFEHGSLSQQELEEMLTIDPEIPFYLEPDSEVENAYVLTPRQPLIMGSTLIISVDEQDFIFGVEDYLDLLSHFPMNNSQGVPIQSGVEFQFTQEVHLDQLAGSFSIDPYVEGEFTYAQGRYVFYPTEPLSFNTRYQVTLVPGYQSATGKTLEQRISFSFTTQSEQEDSVQSVFHLSGNGKAINTLPGEAPLLRAYLDMEHMVEGQEVDVTVYALDSWQDYYDTLVGSASGSAALSRTTSSSTVDITPYRKDAAFSLVPLSASTGYDDYTTGQWVLQFPEALPEGWYIVNCDVVIDGIPVTRQVFLQVSDLSVFTMTMDKYMVVWVNDITTGQPVEQAKIEVSGSYLSRGVTGADGTASMEDGFVALDDYAYTGQTVFTVTDGERTFVGQDLYASYTTLYEPGVISHQYLSYLYCDRAVYRTTDTIQVWGMVRPRHDGVEAPQSLTLSLGEDYVTQEVRLAGDGTFTASLSYEALSYEYTSLSLNMGEASLASEYLRIQDYVKPVYTASTAPDRPVYLLSGGGGDITATIDVSMFDGTPASSFSLALDTYKLNVDGSRFRTDSEGHLEVDMRIAEVPEETNTWYPRRYWYYFSSDEAQAETFTLTGSVYAIHRDVILKGTPDYSGNGVSLEVTTHRVDISGITSQDELWERDAFKGQALSQQVEAELYRVYYDKVVTGTEYDFINRTTRDSYRYERREDLEDIFTFSTVGGTFTLADLPRSDGDNSYYVRLTTRDSNGGLVETTVYLYSRYDYYGGYSDGSQRYQLMKVTSPDDVREEEFEGTYYYYANTYRFADGEDVSFTLQHNDEDMAPFQGKLLYAVVQDDFQQMGIVETGQVALSFDEALVPGYLLTGAYFDGRRLFVLEDTRMNFDYSARELEISLETDRASYQPGDTVNVTATVRSARTGDVVEGAQVVLSVVDEAVFAVRDQSVNLIGSLYENMYYPFVRKYTSYSDAGYNGPGGAEMGGGGDGDTLRRDFSDTAHFQAASTDSGGKAAFTVTLPDSITSWRLTSLTISEDNYAGNDKVNIPSTKPFYVMPIVNENLIQGDSFAVGLYSAGVEVSDTDSVRYQISLSGNGLDRKLEAASTIRGYASVDFGLLDQGDYTVTVQGSSGSYSDGVELPVSVTASGVEVSQVRTFDLRDGIDVQPARYPVNITFYSKSGRLYNEVFRSVQSASHGGRTDMRIARKYIAMQYKEQGIPWYDEAALDDALSDVGVGDILRLFPYSDGDYELTVKAYLAAPHIVGTEGLTWLASQDPYSYSYATYLARALTQEDFSENVAELLESSYGLDFVDKMYLVMAMAQSGQADEALEWYTKLVEPNKMTTTGISGLDACYVDSTEASLTVHQCTAAAAMAATMLESEDAGLFITYLAQKESVYDLYLLEQLYYLTAFSPDGSETGTFRYTRDGSPVTQEVVGSITISFNAEQLAEAGFQVEQGDIYADAYFAGSPENRQEDGRKLIGLTKRVDPVDGTMEPGSLVRVTLTPDFSSLDGDIGRQLLVLDDYIPTGMRFEDYRPDTYSRGWYLNSRQGQRLQFTLYDADETGSIVYYARCSTPGDYVVESAYISSKIGEVWGTSPRSSVTILPEGGGDA